MTEQQAIAKAKQLSKAQIRTFYVIEHDEEEGRTHSVVTEHYVDSDEFVASDSHVVCTAYAGVVEW